MREGIKRVEIDRDGLATTDFIAMEEPLEIRVQWTNGHGRIETIAVTMRTPGQDEELAVGFLFTEGIVQERAQIVDAWSCRSGAVRVALAADAPTDHTRLERRGFTTSSCGLCGKTSADALAATPRWSLSPNEPRIPPETLQALPQALRSAQALFDVTGGLHASALFDLEGRLLAVREDVGRHNALDKLIGAELLGGRLPARERILIVSGRVSFELVQKARMAAIPIVGAIGAPSSAAVELAQSSGMTLVGFLRADRYNVYADAGRLRHPEERNDSYCHPEERNDEGSAPRSNEIRIEHSASRLEI
jgi:FdhD protein